MHTSTLEQIFRRDANNVDSMDTLQARGQQHACNV
jgi:hypothetical protein